VSKTDGPGPELSRRLGYLLKHAQLRMAELTAAALAPYVIDGRELGVLLVLADGQPASQQQAAQLVSRHPDADDRRRNVVELTDAGRDILQRAAKASDDAERAFLAPLSPQAAQQLRNSLHAIVTYPDSESC
jgi:hypothetical protein